MPYITSAICLIAISFLLGNCAILKPSEISQATEKLIAELIPKYLSQVIFGKHPYDLTWSHGATVFMIRSVMCAVCVLSCRSVMQSFVVEQKRPRHCWRIDLIISSTQV